MRLARAVTAAAVAVLVAGCGSTLQSTGAGAQDGLVPGVVPTGDGLTSGVPLAPGATAGPGTVPGPGGVVTGPDGTVIVPGPGGTVAPTSGAVSPGAPSGARITAPISLGFLYAVNDGAAPAGIDNGNTITPGGVMRAYVDSWNDSGGIGGRKIEPVYAELHSYDSNYEGQIESACSKFTEDNHVVAVLATFQYYSEQLLRCLGEANVLLVSGDFVAPDRQDAQRYPLFVTPLSQVGEDREASVVRHLAADGFLSSRNRVGVIVEDCAVGNRIYTNGLVPALRSADVPLASTFHTACFQSIQDFGSQTSQMSSAVLQFRRAQVDRVMVVSAAAEANIVFAFSEVADNQRYEPGYGLSTVAIPVALQLNAPARQMQNMRGVGWLPVLDTSLRSQVPTTSTAGRCTQRLKGEGVQTQSSTDRWTAWSGCEVFSLYGALLDAARGNADPATLLGALPQVVPSYVAASTNRGALGTRSNRVVPRLGRIFAFDSAKQFHYVGGTFQL